MATLSPSTSYSRGLAPSAPVKLVSEETDRIIELLDMCDRALKACAENIKVRNEIIETQGEALVAAEARERALEQRLDGTIYAKVIWFSLGVLLTGAAVALIK